MKVSTHIISIFLMLLASACAKKAVYLDGIVPGTNVVVDPEIRALTVNGASGSNAVPGLTAVEIVVEAKGLLSCTISPALPVTSTSDVDGVLRLTWTTPPVTGDATYQVTCTGADGAVRQGTATITVPAPYFNTQNIVGLFDASKANGTSTTVGCDFLNWTDLSPNYSALISQIQFIAVTGMGCTNGNGWNGNGTQANPWRLTWDGGDDTAMIAGTGVANNRLSLSQGSVFAWIRVGAGGETGIRRIVNKRRAYGMLVQNGVFGITDFNGSVFRSSTVNVADTEWHHVGFVFQSGVSEGTGIYVDGVKENSVITTVQGQNVPVFIGSGSDTSVNNLPIDFYRGDIGHIVFYSSLLTEQQVDLNYRADCPKYRTDCP